MCFSSYKAAWEGSQVFFVEQLAWLATCCEYKAGLNFGLFALYVVRHCSSEVKPKISVVEIRVLGS